MWMAGEPPASTWSVFCFTREATPWNDHLLTLFFPMLKLRISGLFVMVGLLAGCAQMGPPVPPSLELPKIVSDLKAVRKGDKVYLRWTVPTQTTDGQTVGPLGVTRICRSPDQKTTRCEQVGQVRVSASAGGKSSGLAKETTYVDMLPPEVQQDPTKILSYSVSVENESGRSAGLSNGVEVPAAASLPAPADFRAQVTADGIVLTWAPISVSSFDVHGSYRIYRQQEGNSTSILAGELPLDPSSTQFVDHGFEWRKTYLYRLTAVREVSGGMHPCGTVATPRPDCATVYQIEGDDTPTVKAFADDVFPPAVPSGLQAVFSGEGQKPFVDLLWAPDAEGDLAGYNVYRHEEGAQAVKINPEPVKLSAYRDFAVQPGKQYFYSVTAVDVRGNESARSEEASERVP
jgi:hypothetical protein